VPLFDEAGGRRSGTGEHVVCLRPRVKVDRGGGEVVPQVLTEAGIEVWAWRDRTGAGGGHAWQRVGALRVTYDGSSGDGGGGHDAD
jgi:hypothetical protein